MEEKLEKVEEMEPALLVVKIRLKKRVQLICALLLAIIWGAYLGMAYWGWKLTMTGEFPRWLGFVFYLIKVAAATRLSMEVKKLKQRLTQYIEQWEPKESELED